MTGVMISGLAALAGVTVGALLPRVIALIPDRAPMTEGQASPGTVAAAASVPRDALDPQAQEPVTPYRTLAGAAHLAWYLAAATGLLWGLLAADGWGSSLPAVQFVAALGVAMAYIDIREHRLPDWLTYPAFGGAVVALGVAALVTGDWSSYGRASVAAAALTAVFLVLALLRPGELGLGDVKLAASLGLLLGWIGWGHLVLGTFLSFALGGIYSAVLLVLRRAGRRTAIPFGPFLLAGTFTAIAWGEAILDAYLG